MPDGTRPERFRAALEAALIFAVAGTIRLAGIDQGAVNDELFHFLGAQHLLSDGTLSLVDGGEPYDRARLFTYLVAMTMDALGTRLTIARLPAVVAGSLIPVAVLLWFRSNGQRWAGRVAAVLVCLAPTLVELSQVVRFYALQQLAFLAGGIGAFTVLTRAATLPHRVLTAAGSAAAFALALHLQVVTLVGLAGVVLFAGAWLLPRAVHAWRTRLGRRSRVAAATTVAGLIALAGFTQAELAARVTGLAGHVSYRGAVRADDPTYYLRFFLGRYAPLCALFPALAIAAVRRHRALAWFCGAIFTVAIAVHSVAAWKNPRYVGYALPLFAGIVALGLVEGAIRFRRFAHEVVTREWPRGLAPRDRRRLSVSLTVVAALFIAAGNEAFVRTAELTTRDHSYSFPLMGAADGPISWERARHAILPITDSVDVVVSAEHVKAIHYLDRVDYVINVNHLRSFDPDKPEFAIDGRVMRPVISRAESLAAIMACYPSGLIVLQRLGWGNPRKIPPPVRRLIERSTRVVPLPDRWGILAFRWPAAVAAAGPRDRGAGALAGTECDELPRTSLSRATPADASGRTPSPAPFASPIGRFRWV